MSFFKNRTVVIDTSVLMSQDNILDMYADAHIVLPLTVVNELDSNKHRDDEPGRNARSVLRHLEQLRNGTSLTKPLELKDGGSLRVLINGVNVTALKKYHLDPKSADNKIVATVLSLTDDDVVLLSNDIAQRIKAATIGIEAFEHVPNPATLSPGWSTLTTDWQFADLLRDTGFVSNLELDEQLASVGVNEFLVLKSGTSSLLARRTIDGVVALSSSKPKQTWGAGAKNKEQMFSLDLLTDPDISLAALDGPAGTGKTFLAIAAGLEQTFEQHLYSRMTIVRPIISVGGQDLGFLPGDLADKLGPWFECVVDTMVALSSTDQTHRQCSEMLAHWVTSDQVTLEAVTYLRGRSLQNTYVIVDETQNLEVSTVKTVITRLGAGSKGVLVGDVTQVDNPWTTAKSNGLSAAIAAFKGDEQFGHVSLTAGQRSTIADKAALLL